MSNDELASKTSKTFTNFPLLLSTNTFALKMPLLVSECGEREANGCYYQEQCNPTRFVQTNRQHEIVQQTQMMSQGYGGNYSQTVWILQKINPSTGSRCALYVTYSHHAPTTKNGVDIPFGTELEWKSISGTLPLPRVRNGMVRQQPNPSKGRVSRKRTLGMLFEPEFERHCQSNRGHPDTKMSNHSLNGMPHQPVPKRMRTI